MDEETYEKNEKFKFFLILSIGGLVLIVALATLFITLSCTNPQPTKEAAETANTGFDVDFNIQCENNLILAKYSIEVLIDGKRLGILDHGSSMDLSVELGEGTHSIKLCKSGDRSVSETMDFSVSKENNKVSCKLKCHIGSIEITEFYVSKATGSE